MRVLVIGGTYFIGRAVVEALLHLRHEVILLNRGTRSVPFPNIEVIHCDRNDTETMACLLRRVEVDAVVDMIAFHPRNTKQAIRLFQGKVKQFIHCSTVAVYFPTTQYPLKESYPCAPSPRAAYAYNKAQCERLLLEAYTQEGFPCTILRLSTIYGPHDYRPREQYFVSRLLDDRPVLLPGGGLNLIHPCYVADAADAFGAVLDQPQAIGQVYNVAGPEAVTLRYYVTILAEVLARRAIIVDIPFNLLAAAGVELDQIPYASPTHLVLETSKLEQATGWCPGVQLEKGLRLTLEWLLANPAPSPWFEDKIAETWLLKRALEVYKAVYIKESQGT